MARDGPAALAFVENCWRRWASGSCWGDPRRRMQWRICDQQAILGALAADGWLVLGRGPEDCGQARGGRRPADAAAAGVDQEPRRGPHHRWLNLERRVRQLFLREPGRLFDGDQVAAAAGVEQRAGRGIAELRLRLAAGRDDHDPMERREVSRRS